MKMQLDLNTRIDPILQNSQDLPPNAVQRAAAIALPFLCLNKTASFISSMGIGAHRTYHAASEFYTNPSLAHMWRLAEVIGALAISTLMANIYQIGVHTYLLSTQIWDLITERNLAKLLEIASQLIYIGSLLNPAIELRAFSLLSQAARELYEASQEGFTPEGIGKAAMAAIRTAQAAPLIKTIRRDWFGLQMTQEKWEEIHENIFMRRIRGEEEAIDLTSIFEEENISGYIQEIDLDGDDFERLILRDLHFRNCNFSDTSFEKSEFYRTKFDHCLMKGALWIQSVANDIVFNHCSMQSSATIRSFLSCVSYSECNLNLACFNSSTLVHVDIDSSNLKETSFLSAEVSQSKIRKSDLTNTLLTTAKEMFTYEGCSVPLITKPVIALSWNFRDPRRFGPIIDRALQSNDAIPLKFEYAPDDIDIEALETEVRLGLEEIEGRLLPPALSRADELLKNQTPQITKMRLKAEEVARYANGLALTGGHDVEPAFYGEEPEDKTHPEDDIRRSMMEFAMLAQAQKNRIPTMGTCRGSQMINVYLGGSLKQHVPGQWGYQKPQWTFSGAFSRLHRDIGSQWIAYSSHHQAVDRVGRHLEVLAHQNGVPKLLASRNGLWMGSQVHPEIHVEFQKTLEYINRDHSISNREELIALYQSFIEKNRALYLSFIRRCAINNC